MGGNEKRTFTRTDLREGLEICPRTLQSCARDTRMNSPKPLRSQSLRLYLRKRIVRFLRPPGYPFPGLAKNRRAPLTDGKPF